MNPQRRAKLLNSLRIRSALFSAPRAEYDALCKEGLAYRQECVGFYHYHILYEGIKALCDVEGSNS